MLPQESQDDFHRERHALHAVLVTFFILFLLSIGLSRYTSRQFQGRWVSLNSGVSAVITRTDGSVSRVKGTHFGVLDRGDRLKITIKMPANREIPDGALCFDMTNAVTSVYSGDQLLTVYGEAQDRAGQQIGDVYYRVPLPEDAWTNPIHISCRITENSTSCRLTRPAAVSQLDSLRYFFFRCSPNILIFLFVFTLFFVAFLILLFYPSRHPARRQGLWLSLFCMLLTLWYLAGNGVLFAALDNIPVCANTEYVALFAMPIAFGMFLLNMSPEKNTRRYLTTGVFFFLTLFLTATVLNFTTRYLHYHALLRLLNVCISVWLVPILIWLFRSLHTAGKSQRLIRIMLIVAGVMSVLEIARYYLARYMGGEELMRSTATFGILCLTGTFLVGYLARLSQLYSEEKNQDFLRRMAYMDILTGLSNRAACQAEIEKLDKENDRRFAVLFFDVNRLKFANDTFGHDMGDRLLRFVAASLQSVFWGQRICGRWGGDEFLVCLTGDALQEKSCLLEQFQKEIDRANDGDVFPFRISVACGQADSLQDTLQSVESAVQLADQRMYQCKRADHFAR